jgi:hypothetical protein
MKTGDWWKWVPLVFLAVYYAIFALCLHRHERDYGVFKNFKPNSMTFMIGSTAVVILLLLWGCVDQFRTK